MGAALFVVLERELEGVDASMDGKALSRAIETLDQVAREQGVRPLSEFFSIDPDEAAAFLEDEGADPDEMELPELRQFSAEEGLTTIRALMLQPAGQAEGVLEDLLECQRLLSQAAEAGIGWHFEVDY
ncbi:hypothetical protein [Gimesia panareensis]|uniref:hypothetical protein n=1 Tax=Gimesia panareensis TaxID=2527978 RepID=UPI00118BC42A|nr:hypothetical protein [Gimesia panareensis]QDU48640.1 hypothetical protein Pan110_09550 [Gimesia panareensis]